MHLDNIKARKGATKVANIPTVVLQELNKGTIPTVNLVEWLAIDQLELANATLPANYLPLIIEKVNKLKSKSALNCIKTIGEVIYTVATNSDDKTMLPFLMNHDSDILRCWATIYVGCIKGDITKKLSLILPFAIDEHFGVREISWIAIRDQLMEEFKDALPIFKEWVLSDNPYQRRFAIESIRPKGVWCKQFLLIQQQPEMALPLLEKLQNDSHKYVQDSVANWLNDASKSNPEFVQSVCEQWLLNCPNSKSTNYIIKRALRSLN